MNNEIYAILAESAELEMATMSKYVGYELTNEDVKEFVKDKTGAATTAMKRLYEKIIAMIDEVILKVLNFKDKAELGGLMKAMDKTVYKPNNKMKVNSFRVGSIAGACDTLSKTMIKGEYSPSAKQKISKDEAINMTNAEYGSRIIQATIKQIGIDNTLNASSVENGTYTKATIEPALMELFVTVNKEAVTISDKEFTEAKLFITSKSTKGVIYLRDSLRRLKISCKKLYTDALHELKKAAKDELKDAEGYKAKDDIREARREAASLQKLGFEIAAIFVSGMMKVIKEAIKYCKQVRKGMSNTKEDKGDEGEKDAGKEKAASESFGYDDIDLAILEAELLF